MTEAAVREFRIEDLRPVEEICRLYWTDPKFLKGVSDELKRAAEDAPGHVRMKYRFFVAEQNGEIVGIAGFRNAPDYMKKFAKTSNPAEFYILASKRKNQGIGEALRLKRIEEAQKMGFTEAVLYSPESHKESWGFHDRLGFERVGPARTPDGEPGMIWRKIFA